MSRVCCLSAFVAAAGLPVAAFGQPTSWLDAVDGTWSDPARWTGGVPGAGSDVTIDATGSAYTSTISSMDYTINSLTLNSADATLNVQSSRTLEVTGTANLLSGVLSLNGGTLRGGVWNVAPGTLSFTSNGANALDGVTLNGDVRLDTTSSAVRVLSGTTISGVFDLAANNARLGFQGDQTLAADIIQSAGNLATVSIEGNTALTIGAGTSITGTRIDIGSAFFVGGTRTLVNNGLIFADGANTTGVRLNSINDVTNNGTMRAANGGRLSVLSNVASFANAGAIIAEGGSRVVIGADNWTNSGTIGATGSTIEFSGEFSTAATGLISGAVTGDAGSSFVLSGIAQNAGQTLASNVFGGTTRFEGGRLIGGTLDVIDPAHLVFSSSVNNALDAVTVNGSLLLDGSTSTLRLRNGTTVSGGIEMAGNSARLGLDAGTTLSNDISQSGGNFGSVTIEGTGTVTFAAGTMVSGNRLDIGGAFAVGGTRTLVNDGSIVADGPNATGVRLSSINDATNNGTMLATNGGRLQVLSSVSAFTNAGSIIAETGSRATIDSANWVNSGTVTAQGDGIIDLAGVATTAAIGLDAGRITGDTGSRLNLSGELNNAGSTLRTDVFGGVIALEAGRINGGIIENIAGSELLISSSSINILDGVSIVGDLALAGSTSTVRFRNGTEVSGETRLNGNNSRLALEGSQTFNGDIRQFDGNVGSVTVEGNGTVVTLGVGSTVSGTRLDLGSAIIAGGNRSLVNDGTITATGANSTGLRVLSLSEVTNNGAIAATADGRLNMLSSVDSFTNNGMITGDAGTNITVGAASWLNAAGATITSAGGSVTLDGAWQNDGQIAVTGGTLTLDGSFTTADIGVVDGRLDRTGSALNIAGELNNTADTVDSTVLGGSATLAGGTITGGTVDNTLASSLAFSSSTNNILDGVSIVGDLDLNGSSSTVRFRNGTSIAGTVNLTGNNARLLFDGTQTFTGNAQQAIGSSASISAERDGTVLTIDSGASITGTRIDLGSAFVAGGNRTIVNNGTVSATDASPTGIRVLSINTFDNAGELSATAAGARLTVFGSVGDFTNTGTVFASADARVDIDAANWTNAASGTISTNGGTIGLGGEWTNLGQIDAIGGTIDLGGAFTTAGSGINNGRITRTADTDLRITGTLDNTGDTLDTAAFGGTANLSAGTIRGGTLVVSNADAFDFSSSASNVLDGVAVTGGLRLDQSTSTVQLVNGTSVSGNIELAGNGARLILRDSQTVANDIRASSSSANISIEGDSTVTVAAGATISGGRIDIGTAIIAGGVRTLVNDGAIVADLANATGIRFINADVLTNNGTFAAINGGRLSVNGSIGDFTNLDTGTLAGGLYRVGAGSRIDLGGAIATNAAAIELLGAGAQFDGLNTLSRNEGELTIAADAQFGLDGDLEFASTSTFSVLVTGVGSMIDVPMLDVVGIATLGGRLVLDFTGYTSPSEGTFRFLDAASFVGDWSMIDVVGIDPTLVSFNAGPGTFNLVPAPGALSILAAAGLIAGRRRR